MKRRPILTRVAIALAVALGAVLSSVAAQPLALASVTPNLYCNRAGVCKISKTPHKPICVSNCQPTTTIPPGPSSPTTTTTTTPFSIIGTTCEIGWIPDYLGGALVGWWVPYGIWQIMPGGVGGIFCHEIPPPPFVPVIHRFKGISAVIRIGLPTIWSMPSIKHPGPPPFSVATTAQDAEAFVNKPQWLALERSTLKTDHVSGPWQASQHGCTGPHVCGTVGIAVTPEFVDFRWSGSYGGPPTTMVCPAGPYSLAWAPTGSLQQNQAVETQVPMLFQFYNWEATTVSQGPGTQPIYGGPGCNGPGGTPYETHLGIVDGEGGPLPVPAYTPRASGIANVEAWVVYHLQWTWSPALGPRPSGLPTTWGGPNEDPSAVAHLTIPVYNEVITNCGTPSECAAG